MDGVKNALYGAILDCEGYAQRLHRLIGEKPDLSLGPDGKVIVFVREDGPNWSLDGFS